MPRDHIVSVRLTSAEQAALRRLGDRPSDVIRELIRDAARHRVHLVSSLEGCLWADGTVGLTWPAVATHV